MHKSVFVFVIAAAAAFGQGLEFEVASIKPAAPITRDMILARKINVGLSTEGNRVNIGYMSLRELIPMGFDVKPFQIDAPEWIGQQRFDIQALMPEGATKEHVPAMLQALLRERFKLKIHKENREQQVYALEVAKS